MATKILNKKITEKEVSEGYFPSQKEQEILSSIINKFRNVQSERDMGFQYFDGRDLIDFIDDNTKRFITNKDEREDIEDWQARVFDPFTRNKVIGILSKVSSAIPVSEVIGDGDEDFRREQIISDLLKYSNRIDDNEKLIFYALLEAIVKGTTVGYEGYEEKTKKVRDIIKSDSGDELSVKEGKKITRKLRGYIIPLEDFYPASVSIRDIKDMPFCFWRTVLPLEKFRMDFSQYSKAENVQPFQTFSADEKKPYYVDFLDSNLQEGNVEVLRYYNQDTDEFIVIANGVWLNPMENEVVAPIPFNHKTLPFWSAIYEPFGSDFFYGKSIPDKLKAMQDTINVLHNMMLDQGFLSIFPIILTEGLDEIEDDFIRPGRRIPVQNPAGYKELQMSTPTGFHQYIMDYTKKVLEETSLDAVNQGAAGQGDRTTATEIERASQSVAMILGLFIQFVKWGIRDKDRLRIQNIFQFYNKPMIEGVLGEGGTEDFNKAFNTYKIEDTVLTSGKRGTKIIEMYRGKENMPTAKELRVQSKLKEIETGKRIEKIAITPNYLRNFEFDVKLVPNPSAGESKSLQKALVMEKARVYMELFGDLIDREELAGQIAEIFGDRPEKLFKKQEQPMMPEMGVEGTGGAGNLGVGQNIIKGMQGNQNMGLAVRDLAK